MNFGITDRTIPLLLFFFMALLVMILLLGLDQGNKVPDISVSTNLLPWFKSS